MRSFLAVLFLLAGLSLASAAEPPLPSWPSPDGQSAVIQTLYGEGKRVKPIFVNQATGKRTDFFKGGTRQVTVLWSPDSLYFAMNFERSHRYGETHIYAVRNGRLIEVTLPLILASMPDEAQGKTVFGQDTHVVKWLDKEKDKDADSVEVVTTIDLQQKEAATPPPTLISHRFLLRIVKDEAVVVPAPVH